MAPYSFDAIDFPGRRGPRTLTPGAERLQIGQEFLIFALADFVEGSYIAGRSRPEFDTLYGRIAVSYSVSDHGRGCTRLRANACVDRSSGGTGLRHLALAAGDKIMVGRQLHTLKARAEAA